MEHCRYKLVIFDMDGTILNTLEDLADSINYALSANGYAGRTLDEVRCFVGNGIRKLVERAVPEGTGEAEKERVYESFTAHYKVHCADKTRPYDGIVELLKSLREAGCMTAVVSNKADYGVQILCDDYFPGLFDAAVGERPGICRKPSPDSVNEVLAKLDVSRGQAVYVGDSDVDVETAKNAGLACIAVEWGFRDRNFLLAHGADVIVSEPHEVLEKVRCN